MRVFTSFLFFWLLPDQSAQYQSISQQALSVGQEAGEDCVNSLGELLMGVPSIHGRVEKKGMLPLKYWWNIKNEDFKNAVNQTIRDRQIEFVDDIFKERGMEANENMERLPLSGPCPVFINHHYKFIFLKNTKTAGTSMWDYFGMFCDRQGGLGQRPYCFEMANLNKIPNDQAAEDMWKDYYVFTNGRNPYVRGASAYNYMLGRRSRFGNDQGECSKRPTFKQFCTYPFIIGVQTAKHNCIESFQHDFYHVEPQAQCLTTASGESAVDFIVSIENLDSDFDELTQILAQRYREQNGHDQRYNDTFLRQEGGLKQLQMGPQKNQYAVKMFQQCGQECMDKLYKYYKEDFDFLGYSKCTQTLSA
eukprot:TRINITY_DN4001_c0_g1_i1.p1 TRINITY_DN4001_c0_g1~~TRINITY_DN4001_c0_g1_i1.p1  ORF type:complete len:362 (-),score=33.02 TRINITY_DN4001_c0_g1_i1:658-1743(-)